MTSGAGIKPDYDAIVIGAGVTGIYQTYLLDKAGMSVLGVDTAEDEPQNYPSALLFLPRRTGPSTRLTKQAACSCPSLAQKQTDQSSSKSWS